MSLFDQVTYLLGRAIPDALDAVVRQAVGNVLPPKGDTGRYRIPHLGTFSSRVAGDLLAFARNQRLDGALIVVDLDTMRVLYFRGGRVVGADTTVVFERLGRVLHRAGLVDEATAAAATATEETSGVAAAAAALAVESVRVGLDLRAVEIAASLFFVHHGHFLIVEGEPNLRDLPALDLVPTDLALEGLRRYDEWRHGKKPATPSPPPAEAAAAPPVVAPPGTPAARLMSEAADELLKKVTELE